MFSHVFSCSNINLQLVSSKVGVVGWTLWMRAFILVHKQIKFGNNTIQTCVRKSRLVNAAKTKVTFSYGAFNDELFLPGQAHMSKPWTRNKTY
jgi:hypothetical protein